MLFSAAGGEKNSISVTGVYNRYIFRGSSHTEPPFPWQWINSWHPSTLQPPIWRLGYFPQDVPLIADVSLRIPVGWFRPIFVVGKKIPAPWDEWPLVVRSICLHPARTCPPSGQWLGVFFSAEWDRDMLDVEVGVVFEGRCFWEESKINNLKFNLVHFFDGALMIVWHLFTATMIGMGFSAYF